MKFHYPTELEYAAIGICSSVAIMVSISNGPILAKIAYVIMFLSLTFLILTENNERN